MSPPNCRLDSSQEWRREDGSGKEPEQRGLSRWVAPPLVATDARRWYLRPQYAY